MSANSKIEWTTHTFNPWIGCTKVSPGCANCYAESEDKRRGWTPDGWGKGKPRKRTTESYWKQALKWERAAVTANDEWCSTVCAVGGGAPMPPHRPRVFPSLCDWLDDEVPIEWLVDFLDLIRKTPNLDWLLLTKRPENFMDRIDAAYRTMIDLNEAGPWSLETEEWTRRWLNEAPRKNVWLGVSVEDQTRAVERIPALLETPAVVRFLSVEPLLGPVEILGVCTDPLNSGLAVSDGFGRFDGEGATRLHWIIVGGESGPKARACKVNWIRDIVAECKTTAVPVFVKQLGTCAILDRDESHLILRDRKGGDWNEWPEDLRIRDFPSAASVSSCSKSP